MKKVIKKFKENMHRITLVQYANTCFDPQNVLNKCHRCEYEQ